MREAGDEIAGYRLEEVIGQGGMGIVWKATQVSLDRTVAVKIIRAEFAVSSDYRKRFVSESRFAASIDDSGVVSIHDAGEDGGELFLVMSYVDGTDLRALLTNGGPLDPDSAVAVVSQVARGLQAVHDSGLVHRDVKPANVLIRTRDGQALLTDFGVARDAEATQLTRSGMLIGTLDYMAPEQIEGGKPDGAADVYSLGAVLYEALTGSPPFAGKSIPAQINAHLNAPPPKPSDHSPALASFDLVIERALSKDPAGRPESPTALATAAREALGRPAATTATFRKSVANLSAPGTRIQNRKLAAEQAKSRQREASKEPPTRASNEPKQSRRKLRRRGAVAGLVLLLAGLAGLALLNNDSRQGTGSSGGAAGSGTAQDAARADGGAEGTASSNVAQDSSFAGTWIGEATQFAPKGTTQRVQVRTTISPSGESGTHSETITGPRGTDECRGSLSRISYGEYRYREEADTSCIPSTQVSLRLRNENVMTFSEQYRTKDGQAGRVVGRLRRQSSSSGSSSSSAASEKCGQNDKTWPGIAAGAVVISTRAMSCQKAFNLLANAPKPTGYLVSISGWSCRKDGEEIEAIYTKCSQGSKSMRILFGL